VPVSARKFRRGSTVSGRDRRVSHAPQALVSVNMVAAQDADRDRLRPSSSRIVSEPLNSHKDEISFPSFSSGFPPSRPTSRGKQLYTVQEYPHVDSNSTLGQFSFAPATQTTVVTTTTTTTTKFPPFVMRNPRRMQELDPKLYPLAATPTPASLRNICFNLGGKPTLFTEAEDAHLTLKEVSPQNSVRAIQWTSPVSQRVATGRA
jgi:hypothetical protein